MADALTSPVVSIVRFGHVVMPELVAGIYGPVAEGT